LAERTRIIYETAKLKQLSRDLKFLGRKSVRYAVCS
jgi:hypothetical protein